MKHYLIFAVIDLIILMVYPIVYIAHHVQKLTGTKPGRKNDLDRAY